jgi:hypothetical protein|tara:strand:- start:356 stop:583 length:228 start_codon:yes stop_codon:yes gene_type:complete
MDRTTHMKMSLLLGGEVPERTVRFYDRIGERVALLNGASHPDPWILALIAEMSAASPPRKPAVAKKKKVEVIPSG